MRSSDSISSVGLPAFNPLFRKCISAVRNNFTSLVLSSTMRLFALLNIIVQPPFFFYYTKVAPKRKMCKLSGVAITAKCTAPIYFLCNEYLSLIMAFQLFSIITTCILLFSKVQSPNLQLNIHTLLYAVSTWPQFWPQYLWKPKRNLLGGQSFLTTVLTTTTEKTGGISGEESSEYHRVLWIKPLNGAKKVKKNSRIRLGCGSRAFESRHSDQKTSVFVWKQRFFELSN